MEEKYVDVKGIRTRYLEAGVGEPLLLVHGGDYGAWCSANDWDLNIEGFAKFFHVFAIDKIGCGFSDNPKSDDEYVIGTTVRHAYDFLHTMKIDSAHVVGHSRGSYTVCRLALEHPEVVKTLVICDSGTLMIPPNPLWVEWKRLAGLIKDIREKQRFLVALNSFRTDHITDDWLNLKIKIVTLPKSQEAASKHEARLDFQFKDNLVAKQEETHEWIRAGRIKAPTLICWGFNDPSAKFDPIGLDLMRLILSSTPRSEIHVFNEAGHYCFREQPEAFVAAVTSFIKSNSGVS